MSAKKSEENAVVEMSHSELKGFASQRASLIRDVAERFKGVADFDEFAKALNRQTLLPGEATGEDAENAREVGKLAQEHAEQTEGGLASIRQGADQLLLQQMDIFGAVLLYRLQQGIKYTKSTKGLPAGDPATDKQNQANKLHSQCVAVAKANGKDRKALLARIAGRKRRDALSPSGIYRLLLEVQRASGAKSGPKGRAPRQPVGGADQVGIDEKAAAKMAAAVQSSLVKDATLPKDVVAKAVQQAVAASPLTLAKSLAAAILPVEFKDKVDAMAERLVQACEDYRDELIAEANEAEASN